MIWCRYCRWGFVSSDLKKNLSCKALHLNMYFAEFSGYIQKSKADHVTLVWNDVWIECYQTIRQNQGQNLQHKFCVYGHIWDKMWTQWVPFGVTSEVGFWWFIIILIFVECWTCLICWDGIWDSGNHTKMMKFRRWFLQDQTQQRIFLFLFLGQQVYINSYGSKSLPLKGKSSSCWNSCINDHGPPPWPAYI